MSFTALAFPIFLLIVFVAYWAVGSERRRVQNLVLVLASAVFYGWWDWRFLSLLATSILVDYLIGRRLAVAQAPRRRKALLSLSLGVNLGLLGYFKYAGFFVESFRSAFGLGDAGGFDAFYIILPVGISFYTFQTLSYTIDVYRGRLQPTESLLDFAAFVSFFPQLVAGPIERASRLLPQFAHTRSFSAEAASDGLRQFVWGLFKKLVVANNCAVLADAAFANPTELSALSLLVGLLAFTFQIYADFSGYSDMAIGAARLFGITLSQNFATPYLARSIPAFWRRWHISLSTWFRDYVYFPLGGSRRGPRRTYLNLAIVFLVSGLWHGAAWTFVLWGALHALYMVAWVRFVPRQAGSVWITFALVVLAWTFFRAPDLTTALDYLATLIEPAAWAQSYSLGLSQTVLCAMVVIAMHLTERATRAHLHALAPVQRQSSLTVRWGLTGLVLSFTFLLMRTSDEPFIYFQF